jgi:translation initiation factor 4E
MYNNVYSVSEIIPNTDYLMFRKGIRPEWEDPRNKKGGKWVVTLPIEEDMEEEADQAWGELCMHMIGGLFPEDCYDLINGAIFSVREKHWRITLWCNDNNNIPKLRRIGNKFKELCAFPSKFLFVYQVHEKAIKHNLDNEAFLKLD